MAKLLKMLWEYMELTALPFFGTGSAQLFGGVVEGVLDSQVPQPTCYWKWVGVSMPQKVGTFSLRPSSTAIWRCSRLSGGLLSSYRSQVALTPALEFYIHPVLLQPGIHVTLPILTSSPSQSSFRFHSFFYLYFPFPPS